MKILRDRCKKRAFDQAWDTYTKAFQDYYKGLGRDGRTKVVNGYMAKVGGRIENHVMQSWTAKEKVEKEKLKMAEIGQQGLILEEAEQRLGGPDKLHAALARGLGA